MFTADWSKVKIKIEGPDVTKLSKNYENELKWKIRKFKQWMEKCVKIIQYL